jgi:thiol-disulfide isomerase/thioredoxin
MMKVVTRRAGLAALGAVGLNLAAAPWARKSEADEALADISQITLLAQPEPPPPISFQAADGSTHRLEEFRGHGMVINFWATWCAPCVAEMPSLAHLAGALAPRDIAVLPMSSDREGAAAVSRFYTSHEIRNLPILLDPHGEAMKAFKPRGIPTTVVIDRAGMVRARMEGGLDWGTDEAISVIRRLILG